jgi:hypothetical protein
MVNGGSPIIQNNNIQWATGIQAEGGNPIILDNNITDCSPAIIANSGTIERNYIDGGVQIGNVTLENNTDCSVEVQGFSTPTISYNNLVSLMLTSSTDVNAAFNWWGTTNTTAIDQKIWDYYDNFNLGKVNYTPFLTAPNPEAMPDPNAVIPTASSSPSTSPSASIAPANTPTTSSSQNPTATPQNQTWTLTETELLGVIAVLLAVILGLLAALIIFWRRTKAPKIEEGT